MFKKIKELYKKYWFDKIYDPTWLPRKINERVDKLTKEFEAQGKKKDKDDLN